MPHKITLVMRTGNKMATTGGMPCLRSRFWDGSLYVGYDGHSRTARDRIEVADARSTTDDGLGLSPLELASGTDSIRHGWARVSVEKELAK